MLKDVTLGQFFPGSSIVHRLDPRCKLLLTIVYIAALFTAQSYVSYAVMLIVTGVCIAHSAESHPPRAQAAVDHHRAHGRAQYLLHARA